MRVSAVFFLCVSMCLTSCARKQPIYDWYVQPTLPASAQLYLDVPDKVHASLFSDENCSLGKYGTRVEHYQLAGVSEVAGYRARQAVDGVLRRIDLEPDKPQVVNFTKEARTVNTYSSTGLLSLCIGTYQFTPEVNHNYLAVVETEETRCRVSIVDLTASGTSGKFVLANGFKMAKTNCNIYEYYSDYQAK